MFIWGNRETSCTHRIVSVSQIAVGLCVRAGKFLRTIDESMELLNLKFQLGPYRGALVGFLVGTVYALLCALAFDSDSFRLRLFTYEVLEFVSLAMLTVTPFVIGVLSIYFGDPEQASNKRYQLYYPWLSILGWSAISLVLAWETLICVLMLLPIYMPLASAGGILGGRLVKRRKERRGQTTVACFVFLPFFLAPIEASFEAPTLRDSYTNSIFIDATPEQVWATLPDVRRIDPRELPWTLSHAIGLPRPISATTDRLVVGGVRDLMWEKGVHFQERITLMRPAEVLAYDVIVDEQSMQIAELDTHIVVGDRYFNVESGRYELKEVDGGTRLALTTSYRMTTRLNWYGRIMADLVLDDLHYSILTVLKNRIEANAHTAASASTESRFAARVLNAP